MDRLSWKSLTWERRKSDLREVSFTPPIPLHTSKSAMFWESRVGYKECEAVFPACNGHVVFFFVRFTTQFQLSFCLFTILKSVLCSSRVHCACIVSLAAAVCLSRVIDTLPLFSPHRRFRAASTHQWLCVRGCVYANTAVWTKEDEERAKGVRWPARRKQNIWDVVDFSRTKLFARLRIKKKKKWGRARGNRTLQAVLGRLEHLYNPNEVRLDA